MKRVFLTGNQSTVSVVKKYLVERDQQVEFTYAESHTTDEELSSKLAGVDFAILLHETEKVTLEKGEENLLFTRRIAQALVNGDTVATVVYFSPRKTNRLDSAVSNLKLHGDSLMAEYKMLTGGNVVIYKYPEIFGPSHPNEILDRIIDGGKIEGHISYEFTHTAELAEEMYRLICGVPSMTGQEDFAVIQGSHFTSEAVIAKKTEAFQNLEPWEIPDFSSKFDRQLYDYYMHKTNRGASYRLGGTDTATIASSKRMGSFEVIRLAPGEKVTVALNGVSSTRLFLLNGEVKSNDGIISSYDGIVRIDINCNTEFENSGTETTVLELWTYNKIF